MDLTNYKELKEIIVIKNTDNQKIKTYKTKPPTNLFSDFIEKVIKILHNTLKSAG
jgi:hypothetical protein